MDDIAKNSGYSKATLYVYFKSKEILTSYLVLQSMQTLYDFIYKALHENNTCKERFLVFAIHFMNIKSSTHCTSH
jgi:AcrR family transcriptional regulator